MRRWRLRQGSPSRQATATLPRTPVGHLTRAANLRPHPLPSVRFRHERLEPGTCPSTFWDQTNPEWRVPRRHLQRDSVDPSASII